MDGDKIRVFIVDDHKILVAGLKNLLTGSPYYPEAINATDGKPMPTQEPGIDFVGDAESAENMFEQLKQIHRDVDVILMDIRLPPGMNGIEATNQVKALYPDIKVIMLTELNERSMVGKALNNHADGYISKTMGKQEFLDGIRKVMQGELVVYVPNTNQPEAKSNPGDKPRPELSKQELSILRLIVDGKTTDEISVAVKLAPHNVNRYKRVLMEKFGVNNAAGLVREAMRLGFCD